MERRSAVLRQIAFGTVAAWLALPVAAPAADLGVGHKGAAYSAGMALNCDNGRTYPIRAVAVSDLGDLVTGLLFTTPRNAVHIRLIPMGDGYRYSGRGIWFDGLRGDAMLYFGKAAAAVSCTVLYG
jgi:hypothetical protein